MNGCEQRIRGIDWTDQMVKWDAFVFDVDFRLSKHQSVSLQTVVLHLIMAEVYVEDYQVFIYMYLILSSKINSYYNNIRLLIVDSREKSAKDTKKKPESLNETKPSQTIKNDWT